MNLWNKNQEKLFFTESLKLAKANHLFYLDEDGRHLAYWPKSYRGVKSTLQSRNSVAKGLWRIEHRTSPRMHNKALRPVSGCGR